MQDIGTQSDQGEISLVDIASFLIANFKLYLASGVLGLLIALSLVSFKGQYTAAVVLLNQGSGLSLVNWSATQRSLLMLAQEVESTQKQAPSIIQAMADSKWWNKAVVPTYAISISEARKLVGINTDMQDNEATRISSFIFKVNGTTPTDAEKKIRYVIDFIRNGSAFINAQKLVTDTESKIARDFAKIDLELNLSELQMKVLIDRRDYLSELRKQFPNENSTPQIIDLKEGTSKFLPITTQLIAVLTDINILDENLIRLKREKSKLEISTEFVVQAKRILELPFSNIAVIKDLIVTEQNIRKTVPSVDLSRISALDTIRSHLVGIQTDFSLGLQQISPPSITPPKYLSATAFGVVGGVFAGFILSLLLLVWRTLQTGMRQKQFQG
jgi:hypothetical protein